MHQQGTSHAQAISTRPGLFREALGVPLILALAHSTARALRAAAVVCATTLAVQRHRVAVRATASTRRGQALAVPLVHNLADGAGGARGAAGIVAATALAVEGHSVAARRGAAGVVYARQVIFAALRVGPKIQTCITSTGSVEVHPEMSEYAASSRRNQHDSRAVCHSGACLDRPIRAASVTSHGERWSMHVVYEGELLRPLREQNVLQLRLQLCMPVMRARQFSASGAVRTVAAAGLAQAAACQAHGQRHIRLGADAWPCRCLAAAGAAAHAGAGAARVILRPPADQAQSAGAFDQIWRRLVGRQLGVVLGRDADAVEALAASGEGGGAAQGARSVAACNSHSLVTAQQCVAHDNACSPC